MSIDELLIFWQTLKHFECAQGIAPSSLQMNNLKKSTIVAMKAALTVLNPSMITTVNSPYHITRQKVLLTLSGEDKTLFGTNVI